MLSHHKQAKSILLSKKPGLNIEKFMELEFSLLCWQTKTLNLTKHQFEDGFSQYIGSYFTLVDGIAEFQKISIETNETVQSVAMQLDQQIYYSLEQSAETDYYYQIIAITNCTITIIKESRIQQLLKNYYSLCEFAVLDALNKLYFLAQENGVFASSLLHAGTKQKYHKKQTIYRLNDAVTGFYLILEGEISITTLAPSESYSHQSLKKVQNKRITQKVLSKNQCFGEQDIFESVHQRREQSECISLECDILFIPIEALVDAYKDKLQDHNFKLSSLAQQFQGYIQLHQLSQQNNIARYKLANAPQQPPKLPMKATDPLFMNLGPLNEKKFSIQKQPPTDVIRNNSVHNSLQNSRHSSFSIQKPQRIPSQDILVNESLTKMNRLEGNYTIQQYIRSVQKNTEVKSNNSSKYQWDKKLGQKCNSVITDHQQKMLDYTRQLTPIYMIRLRKGKQQSRRSSMVDGQSSNKKDFLVLYPEYRQF